MPDPGFPQIGSVLLSFSLQDRCVTYAITPQPMTPLPDDIPSCPYKERYSDVPYNMFI